jgi:hypothetical protein
LKERLPAQGRVLEVASGSGQHLRFFATLAPHLQWIPSDLEPDYRASQKAWCAELPQVLEPLELDVRQSWPLEVPLEVVLAINLIHIAPWEVTGHLMAGARKWLVEGGMLYLYGAFKRDGRHTAPSNQSFDAGLRQQNSQWGVRDLEQVVALAEQAGLRLNAVLEMPSNNLSVIFQRPHHEGQGC